MTFVPPSNEQLLTTMPRAAQLRYRMVRDAAERSAAERPELDHRIYTQYLGDYLGAAQKNSATLTQMAKNFQTQGVPQIGMLPALRTRERGMQLEFQQHFLRDTLPAYSQPGAEAWNVLNKKLDHGGPVEWAFKQVYNSDKGGLQFAGIIGAVLGGIMAKKVFGGLQGGMIGIFSMVVAPIIGAYILNRTLNALNPGPNKPIYLYPSGTPLRTPGVSAGVAATPPSPSVQAQAKAAVTNAPPQVPVVPSQGTNVTPGTNLAAPATPAIPPAAGRATPGNPANPTR